MWFDGAASMHTFAMRTSIDVVFVDASGRVLHVVESLPPWRAAAARGARDIVELAPGTCAACRTARRIADRDAMALAYVAVAIVVRRICGQAINSPYVDGDLFWQKHLGAYVLAHHALPTALGHETFSAPGAPWIPQEWLLGIVAAIAFDTTRCGSSASLRPAAGAGSR